ncbi:hypothetical protein [Enterovirga rhinocerotis]|uniref:Glycosyltransferase RgtA/B/C/D-like domain-containing protein n=1 Tax=Enterovirga rhinocerotis TaxID=1339210 RepID=A0A4R7BU40_9HYPH|nr:hypothetical protein [Enterovirga rhinocerotis]TDR88095.1 hypothetical protein EV668_3963 [Enterovirga rhinocerotis]
MDRPALGLALLVVIAIAPMLVAGPVPALLDYPNHLARMSILMRDGTPDANPHYEVVWSFVPNLAMDAIVPPLGRLVGIEAATLLFLIVSQALVIGGAVSLDLAVKGRIAWAGYAAVLFLYAPPFAWSFLNFQFGLGLALLAFAMWIRQTRRTLGGALAWHALACLVLFVSHLFALGLYGWAIGLYELWRWRQERIPLSQRSWIVLALVLPPAALFAITLLSGASVGAQTTLWSPASKLLFGIAANGFSRPVSLTILVAIAGGGWLLARRGELRSIGAGPLLAAGFVVLYLLMPHRLLDSALVDIRVPLAAALILPAFVEIRFRDRAAQTGTRIALGLLLALNLSIVTWNQSAYSSTYRAFLASAATLPRGARVLSAYDEADRRGLTSRLWDLPIHHLPTLAILEANAFVPTLFMHPGKQPIRPAPDVRRLSVPDSDPPSLSVLKEFLVRPDASIPIADHLRHWVRDFEYLYLLSPLGPVAANPLPHLLSPISSDSRFTLYRIVGPARTR